MIENVLPEQQIMLKNAFSVVFDLGGVLFDWNPRKLLERRYANPAHRELLHESIFRHADWQELDRGTLDESTAIQRFQARTNFPSNEIAALMQDVRESLTPLEDSWLLLHDLRRRGVPLYCLSNMAASTFVYLQSRYSRWEMFDGIVISSEIGMLKPDREIYEHLLGRFGLQARRTVFIDDHEPNVIGARSAGIQAIHFTGVEDCRRQLAALD